MTLRALLLDFDGVLADSEPIHLQKFQEVLKGEGITPPLTKEQYYERYLGLDDASFFETFFRDSGKKIAPALKEKLIRQKNRSLLQAIRGGSLLLPGVRDFLEAASEKYYVAVVSGALKNEIEAILKGGGVDQKVHLIVAADDVSQGKPHPEGFLTAIRLLNRDFVPESELLLPQECLAIEDSPWGIEAARQAGVKCVAVLTSYPREKLTLADRIIPDLQSLNWADLEGL